MNYYEEFLEYQILSGRLQICTTKKQFQDHNSGPAEWNEMKVFYIKLITK